MAKAGPTATSAGFGLRAAETAEFDWPSLKSARDAYVGRLQGNYKTNWEGEGIDVLAGEAHFTGERQVEVALDGGGTRTIRGEHVLIWCLPGGAD